MGEILGMIIPGTKICHPLRTRKRNGLIPKYNCGAGIRIDIYILSGRKQKNKGATDLKQIWNPTG